MNAAASVYVIALCLNRASCGHNPDIRRMNARTQIDFDRLRDSFAGTTRPTTIELDSIAQAVGVSVSEITIRL